ncbi:MAG TPA: hypothetical protein VFG50_17910 [Rhodothermales bacterium]|nr:hypothetical protein [Rhodothermales bacterium]
MANASWTHTTRLDAPAAPGAGASVAVGLAAWFALILLLGAGEVFVTPDGIPPLALLVAATVPVILFLTGYWVSPRFRAFVLATDPRFTTGIQAWRIGGFAFLVLYTYGILPGYFAWPAGLGDMAIGATAPWLLATLIRKPGFAASKTFVVWNVLGLVDLIAAVSMGAFGARLVTDASAGLSAAAQMTHLPLVLVPAFFVPAYVMLHLTALFQARHVAG